MSPIALGKRLLLVGKVSFECVPPALYCRVELGFFYMRARGLPVVFKDQEALTQDSAVAGFPKSEQVRFHMAITQVHGYVAKQTVSLHMDSPIP